MRVSPFILSNPYFCISPGKNKLAGGCSKLIIYMALAK